MTRAEQPSEQSTTDAQEGRAMIENTTQRDPAIHLLGSMSEGLDGYIVGMEAAGQGQVVNSDVLPSEGPWDSLAGLGFVKGDPVEGDDLFVRCTLPDGWVKVGTDHNMWSKVLDERGIERVSIFYKAAFYDRKAFCRLSRPGSSLACEAFYGDTPATGLPEQWSILTEDERADFWAEVDRMAENAEQHPDIYGKHSPTVTALLALR